MPSETIGELSIAGKKDVPPFHLWKFGLHHYHQYLLDQLEVHSAIESALSKAAGKWELVTREESRCVNGLRESIHAMLCFADLKMSRVDELNHDIAAIEKLAASKSDSESRGMPSLTLGGNTRRKSCTHCWILRVIVTPYDAVCDR